jgi:hypothetical protein
LSVSIQTIETVAVYRAGERIRYESRAADGPRAGELVGSGGSIPSLHPPDFLQRGERHQMVTIRYGSERAAPAGFALMLPSVWIEPGMPPESGALGVASTRE